MPRFDGDPVFHALLDSADGLPRDGSMLVELEGLAQVEQSYEHGTAILQTRLLDAHGQGVEIVRLRAALLQPRPRSSGRPSWCGGSARWAAIRACASRCSPRGEWGTVAPAITRGSNHLRYVLPSGTLRLTTNAPPTYLADGTWFSLHGPVSLLFGPDETLSGGIEETAREFEEQTSLLLAPLDAPARAAARVAGGGDPRGDHAEAVPVRGDRRDRRRDDDQHSRGAEQRAQLGLPLLLAARCVLRRARAQQPVRSRHDGGLPALALRRRARLRATATCSRSTASGSSASCRNRSCRTCRATAAWGRCASATRRTSTSSTTSTATSCSARRRPSTTIACSGAPTRPTSRALEAMGEQAWLLHDQPDAGMWELRTRARVHTSSSLMCWAACDRLAKIARTLGAARARGLLARARRHHPREDPRAGLERRSARPSSRASAARTSMPACC